MLLKILSSIRYLARQGLALRGNGDETDNFLQLLQLKAEEDPAVLEWLKRKTGKYTSPEVQNDLLKVMAMHAAVPIPCINDGRNNRYFKQRANHHCRSLGS